MNYQKTCLNNIKHLSNKLNIPIISNNTEKFIVNLLNTYKPKNCLEIGTSIGYSIILQASIIQNRNGNIYGFEISKNTYKQTLDNINKSKLKNIVLYNFDFLKFPFKKVIREIDFVFIDAKKADYYKYLKLVLKIVNKNSIILLDDVIKFNDKMTTLYEFIKKNQLNYKIFQIDKNDGVMIIYI
ncbi:O-methyltransferase [Candidatus Vampirococcus lugosii]|uniref:O-methyltransferase n=1 Tax=Candidatus Vampirococcus lugosii TaxID=2789015 RepID=A0ABS5QMC0_9BACT|nr:class I SAM-dependent methyltransferase [Candidatus Vampirococcus lugosii]MBS8122338.1 O-methyltransferase [Candidatus Vampirococcus lugosii]